MGLKFGGTQSGKGRPGLLEPALSLSEFRYHCDATTVVIENSERNPSVRARGGSICILPFDGSLEIDAPVRLLHLSAC